MPKKTLETILATGNDYIVALKGNRWKLYCQVIALTIARAAIDTFDYAERGHGRRERRRCSIYPVAPATIDNDWPGVRRVIVVDRWRESTGGTLAITRHYYLSSRSNATAGEFAQWVRAHWRIENSLHWVKDVIQHEDACGISGKSSAETLSLLKTWAISIFGVNGFSSIKNATIRFANKINELFDLTRT